MKIRDIAYLYDLFHLIGVIPLAERKDMRNPSKTESDIPFIHSLEPCSLKVMTLKARIVEERSVNLKNLMTNVHLNKARREGRYFQVSTRLKIWKN